jgi:hypothetical protein
MRGAVMHAPGDVRVEVREDRGLRGHGPAHRHQGPAHPLTPMALTRTMLTAPPTIVLTALLATGCGDNGGTARDERAADGGPTEKQENRMDLEITVRNQSFGATLQDSAAARDLVAQLPVTVEMTDHGGVEKTGPLPGPLSLEGQPEAADPDVGDLGYYAPGNDLVLYYGDQSSFAGIVVLGRMDDDAAERIADLEGPVTVTVEAR